MANSRVRMRYEDVDGDALEVEFEQPTVNFTQLRDAFFGTLRAMKNGLLTRPLDALQPDDLGEEDLSEVEA